MSDYKQCCTECGFHFFDEDECPNCEAYQWELEYDRMIQAEYSALSTFSATMIDEDQFLTYWYSHQHETRTWFRSLAQKLAPELFNCYNSIDVELYGRLYEEPEQMDLFETDGLPF